MSSELFSITLQSVIISQYLLRTILFVLWMPDCPQDERPHDRNAQQRPNTAHIPADADGRVCQGDNSRNNFHFLFLLFFHQAGKLERQIWMFMLRYLQQ